MVKLVWHTGRTSIFFLSTRSLMPRYYAYKKGTSVEHLTPKSTSRIVRCWKEQTRASNTSHLNIFSRALFKNRNSSRPHDSKIVLFPAKGSSNEREREREKKKENWYKGKEKYRENESFSSNWASVSSRSKVAWIVRRPFPLSLLFLFVVKRDGKG